MTEACAPLQAVYTSLKETETRATDLLPYWKVGLCRVDWLLPGPLIPFERDQTLMYLMQ